MAPYRRKISIDVDGVGCDRAGAPVFRGATFKLAPGEALQVFGANGAGKSSLLGLIAGHFPPAEGTVRWRDGDDAWAPDRPQRAAIFLGHERGAKLSLTVRENLDFWRALYGRAAGDREGEMLDRLRLSPYAHAPVARLSAGQRRRLDFARLLIANRPFWLLDEPSAFVDYAGARLVAEIIDDHQQRGGVAIIATHDRLDLTSADLSIG